VVNGRWPTHKQRAGSWQLASRSRRTPHRKLYVACTRAQTKTLEVPAAESAQPRATPAQRSRSARGRR
jgi:hypothetical protein